MIRKHIITPSTLLSETRPLVLVGWGCRLSMGEVDEQEVMVMAERVEMFILYFKQVVDFIKKHGLKGPEGTYPKEGQYIQVPKFTNKKKDHLHRLIIVHQSKSTTIFRLLSR